MPLKILPQLFSAICLFRGPRLICYHPSSNLRSHEEATCVFCASVPSTWHKPATLGNQLKLQMAIAPNFSLFFLIDLCSNLEILFLLPEWHSHSLGSAEISELSCLSSGRASHRAAPASSALILLNSCKGIPWFILITEPFSGALNRGARSSCLMYF